LPCTCPHYIEIFLLIVFPGRSGQGGRSSAPATSFWATDGS